MTQLPLTGELKLSETLTHFGAPSFSECYRGGTYVPDLTAGAVEEQRITPTGTRSNVVTGGGVTSPETITIGFDPDFDGGVTQNEFTVTLGDISGTSFSLVRPVNDYALHWPAAAATALSSDASRTWTYTTPSQDTYDATSVNPTGSQSRITTSSTFAVNNWVATITVNITNFTVAGGFWRPMFRRRLGNTSSGSANPRQSASGAGSHTFVYDISDGSTSFEGKIVNYAEFGFFTEQDNLDAADQIDFNITSVVFSNNLVPTTHYDFDIDNSGEHFPGSGGIVDIDCTNASGDGSGTIAGRLHGNWRTSSQNFTRSQPATAQTIAAELFQEANRNTLRSDVTVVRGTGIGGSFVEDSNGLVVRISTSSEGFTFWMTDFGENWETFAWDVDWDVRPTIYVDGVEYPTENVPNQGGTAQAIAGSQHDLVGNFPDNTNTGQLAAQHFHDQIEATYTGVTVAGPTEITGVGGTVDIDCTNIVVNASTFGYFIGNWRTDGNEFFNVSSSNTPAGVATVFFNEASTSLRSDVTVSRGTGVGDSFTEDVNGLVIRIASTSNGFSFWMGNSVNSGIFTWATGWTTIPVFYVNGVEFPVINTNSFAAGTPATVGGVLSQWQIVVDTGIDDDVVDATLTITEGIGENTEPLTFTVTDGSPGGGTGVHSTYVLNDYSGDEVTMFTSSVASASDSDLAFVFNTAKTAVDDNPETPINFTATNDTTHLTLDAATAGYVDGLFTLTAMHGSGDGNLSFATTEQTRGVPVGTNGNIPTSGELKLTNFYGGDNGSA